MTEYRIEDWLFFFQENVKGARGRDLVRGYLAHIEAVTANNLPPIFEFSHLSELLGIEGVMLAKICHAPHLFYRTFQIPKRTGGHREISVPRPILMTLQQWILDNILERGSVHKAAHAFVKSRSIVTNAQQHLGCKELLKIDIVNFFPSIKSTKVQRVFKNFGYPSQVAAALTRICTKNGSLPQGAPTSPAISNLVAAEFDAQIEELCASCGLTYTRYADDLAISGDGIPSDLRGKIAHILAQSELNIHPLKSRTFGLKDRKIIAGISISSGRLMPTRHFVRSLRRDVHHVITRGLLAHMAATDNFDPIYLERLLGKIAFWMHVTSKSHQSIRADAALRKYMAEAGL
ncbi:MULTISPECIES: reverse transcriptase domain-containing protein [unclassified Sinorhizobium]|uniref:reverse transcriptase domain-containing protein n=1 Tax=unclassified Sinorhizobium TaxID=2613772 RepID=UPI0024C38D28|nr:MULTISPECIES: reverse transcriptase domain-containing protein [unclassified Sinorhizobium]MDK1377235.1 reverse transcriptase domain-containing protein [Sinorhizobium sp. 6-70]MDK1478799.1 reverse transcriptase domain-containing protein [Sinorhizobium sp. 6-117]